jgi:hypothetical protein
MTVFGQARPGSSNNPPPTRPKIVVKRLQQKGRGQSNNQHLKAGFFHFNFAARKLNRELVQSLKPEEAFKYKQQHFAATSAQYQLGLELCFANAQYQKDGLPFKGT